MEILIPLVILVVQGLVVVVRTWVKWSRKPTKSKVILDCDEEGRVVVVKSMSIKMEMKLELFKEREERIIYLFVWPQKTALT